MEASEMSEASVATEGPSEASTSGTREDDDGRTRTAIVAICCLLLFLFLLFMFLGFLNDSTELDDENLKTKPPVYSGNQGNGGDRKPASTTDAVGTMPSRGTGSSGQNWSSWATSPSSGTTQTQSTIPSETTTPSQPGTSQTTATTTTTTGSTTTTTTEDSWHYSQDYTLPVWTYLHKFLCPFWSEKQGFRSHRRTYGIAYFPYMFCHYAMYCCYTLDDQMQLQPERPEVDLPPRDAVRRMAGFKAENYHLKVWLVVRGADAVFHKLLQNSNGEKATFHRNAIAWMRGNNYDGIRIWWTTAPDSLNRSLAELYNDTNDVFNLQENRTFGLVIPYGHHVHAAYNTSKLAHRRAYHTIIMYHDYPRNLTNRKATTYTLREHRVYSQILNQTDRPAFCHLMPFVALRYKIDPAKCGGNRPYQIVPLGYGPPGPLTKTAGILSLPEVCDIVDSTWNTTAVFADNANLRPNYHFACKGEDAIAYTTGEDAELNVGALDTTFEEEVFGVMNPEYDDFPGICPDEFGTKYYPIVRGIFLVYHHG
ncbi:hypothetical protein V5799_024748 [Amblyomma americanum]|uniref:GH18 domain-containing protein n=1 Tax=Amblyomma americanum TaxID=6943 RepID=A0AAQ4EBN8_AMBAM